MEIVFYLLLISSSLGIAEPVSSALLVFDQFNFLWTDDMLNLYKTFEEENPDPCDHHNEMKRILAVENKIGEIPQEIIVCGAYLNPSPIKDSFTGFCMAWKMCYVQKLHNVGKVSKSFCLY